MKQNLRISLPIAIIALVAIFWSYYYSKSSSQQKLLTVTNNTTQEPPSTSDAGVVTPTEIQKAAAQIKLDDAQLVEKKKALENIATFVKKEAQKIGAPVEDPEREELRLRNIAQDLTDSQLNELVRQALDTSLDGDTRAMAATLISWNGKTEALTRLAQISSAPIAKGLENRNREQEVVLRAIAIESLVEYGDGALAVIRSVEKLITDTALIERLQRVKLAIQSNRPEQVKKADFEALQKLQEK